MRYRPVNSVISPSTDPWQNRSGLVSSEGFLPESKELKVSTARPRHQGDIILVFSPFWGIPLTFPCLRHKMEESDEIMPCMRKEAAWESI